jgi:ankyrin repeat protein
MKTTKLLLDNGADIEAKDITGKTPLHLATVKIIPYSSS